MLLKRTTIVVAIVIVAGLTGCGGVHQATPGGPAPQSAVPQLSTGGTSGPPAPVVGSIRSEATLKEPIKSVNELVRSTSLTGIVEGTIVDVTWAATDEGLNAQTRYQVNVDRDLTGKYAGTISITEPGGYLEADAVRRSADEKFGTVSPARTGYIEDRFEGATHPAVGDRVLLFVRHSFGSEGTLALVSSVYGRFTLDKSGRYVRAAAEPGWDAYADVKVVEAALGR